jgi:parallel beta helix pectate lyase-like protein
MSFVWSLLLCMASASVFSTTAWALDIRVEKYGFLPSASPADNTAAWNRAIAAIPSTGARVVIPDGTYYSNGLLVISKHRTQIVGGGGDGSRTGRTKLICAQPNDHCLRWISSNHIEVKGLYLGHSVPTSGHIAALVLHGFLDATVDNVSTWSGGGWDQQENSANGLLAMTLSGVQSGGLRVQNSMFMSHPQFGIEIIGASDTADIQETSIFNNHMMNNAGGGLLIGHWVGGLYFRGNSLWKNRRAIYAPATTSGATRDIFIENNIIDCSTYENIYMTNVDSGHIKSNWVSCAGGISGHNVFGMVIQGGTSPYPPNWEISDNKFVINRRGGLSFDLKKARIHNNTFRGSGLDSGDTSLALSSMSGLNSVFANHFTDTAIPIEDVGTGNVLGVNTIEGYTSPVAHDGLRILGGALGLTTTFTPPPLPDTAQMFARPGPNGKMQAVILWPNGAVGVLATEP